MFNSSPPQLTAETSLSSSSSSSKAPRRGSRRHGKMRKKVTSSPSTERISPFTSPLKLRSSITGFPWHKDIEAAIKSQDWEKIKRNIQFCSSITNNNHASFNSSSGSVVEKKSFWSRLAKNKRGRLHRDRIGLLTLDDEQRTPLHCILTIPRRKSNSTVTALVLQMIDLEPRAASMANHRGRLPLHFAVVHRAPLAVVAALVDAYPPGIAFVDSKKSSPLQYAVDIAKRESVAVGQSGNGSARAQNMRASAPRSYWMPLPNDNDHRDRDGAFDDSDHYSHQMQWQQQQTDRWGVVHWLLLASATNPQTSLSVGGKKPMLVDALLHAAPPPVISLLVGASVMLLSHESKATAFAGSTLYSCVTRHYPASILQNLANQCPNDVTKVRDETGMGIVSAQFISACFEQISITQDWTVVEGFYEYLLECISQGELGDEPAFIDWWNKIEFLIAFCSRPPVSDPINWPKHYLLHSALSNADIPPAVFSLLLSLYPGAVFMTEPRSRALPIHLACQRRDYIPRSYEISTIQQVCVLDDLLDADPPSIRKRYSDRLPLHLALASGRLMATLRPILAAGAEQDETGKKSLLASSQLMQRDPKSHLYPFMQAATYTNRSDEDSFRWTCVARNKYSHAVWRGLSDRQKAIAVLKVQDGEELARLDTIFQLLRLAPRAIDDFDERRRKRIDEQQRRSRKKSRDTWVSEEPMFRDISELSSKGPVSLHYMSWCFVERIDNNRGYVLERNTENQNILRQAVAHLLKKRDPSLLPQKFLLWWAELKGLLRSGSQRAAKRLSMQHYNIESSNLHEGRDEYLLHAALLNSDTPPEIVEILLAIDSEVASLCMPDTSILPLHIASRTPTYRPCSSEKYKKTSLNLVLEAYPQAAQVSCDGQLPLHIAILNGKSCPEIRAILDQEPRALLVKDPNSDFFPFQLMAMYKSFRKGNPQAPRKRKNGQTNQKDRVRFNQQHDDLDILDSTFLLLRRGASVIQPTLDKHELSYNSLNASESDAKISCYADSGTLSTLSASYLASKKTEIISSVKSSEDDDSSFCRESKKVASPISIRPTSPSALILLLSQHHRNDHLVDKTDIFEGEASQAFSQIDVMSSMSSLHSSLQPSKHTIPIPHIEDEASIDIYRYARTDEDSSSDDSSSYDDFAEESVIPNGTLLSGQDSKFHESPRSVSSEDHSVVFELRRVPRFSKGKLRGSMHSTPATVKLSKTASNSMPSTLNRESGARRVSQASIVSKSSSSDKHSYPSRFSYKSIQADEKKKIIGTGKEMMWMDQDLLTSNLQKTGCGASIDASSVSLSLVASQHENGMAKGKLSGSNHILSTPASALPKEISRKSEIPRIPISGEHKHSRRASSAESSEKDQVLVTPQTSNVSTERIAKGLGVSLLPTIDDSSVELDDVLYLAEQSPVKNSKQLERLRAHEISNYLHVSTNSQIALSKSVSSVISIGSNCLISTMYKEVDCQSIHEKYFDKSAMKWKFRAKQEMGFDKATMRWVPRTRAISTGSSQAAHKTKGYGKQIQSWKNPEYNQHNDKTNEDKCSWFHASTYAYAEGAPPSM